MILTRHLVLDTKDNADADNGEDKTRKPHPHLDLIVLGCRILNVVLTSLGAPFLENAKLLAHGTTERVYASRCTTAYSLASEPQNLPLQSELGEGNDNHE